jgi:PAS domain S-box-containing protein
MRSDWGRSLAVVAILLVLLTVLLIRTRSPDLVLRERMQEAIRNYRLFDAELTGDILAARAGLRSNYDPLAADRRNLVRALKDLRRESAAGSKQAQSFLAPPIDRLRGIQSEQLDSVERFKSRNALLQNSLRYVTSARPVLHVPVEQTGLSADINLLSNAVLHFMQVRDADDERQIWSILERLAAAPGFRAESRTLVEHGRLIVTLIPETDELLRRITQSSTDVDPVAELQTAVLDYDRRVEKIAQVYRVLLYAVAVLLLGYIVLQFARLRRAIVDRLHAATALRASEARFRAISESAKEAIVSVGNEGKIVSWNSGAAAMFGYPAQEILGQAFRHLWPAAYRHDHERALADFFRSGDSHLGTATPEFSGLRKDGSEFPIEVSLSTWATDEGRFLTAIMRDVSERRRLHEDIRQKELQLIQKNRMAVLGLLVSGVAHDISNQNDVILKSSSTLGQACEDLLRILDSDRRRSPDATLAGLPYDEMRQLLPLVSQDIREAAMSIHHIEDDLRDSYRARSHSALEPFDLNDVVLRSVRLLRHKIDDNTRRFRTDLALNLPPAIGDAPQFGQVIGNLLINALEALPDPSRGVTVSTSYEESRKRVILVVEDQGVGISEADLRRISEPFFSTKQASGGTGLGVAITTALLSNVGGHLHFESEPGKGTRAIVDLGCAT